MKIILSPEFQEENSTTYLMRKNDIVFSERNGVYKLSIGSSFTIIFKSDLEFKQFVDYSKDAFLALTGK